VALSPRADRLVRARSAEMADEPIEYELGGERRGGGWGDYVQGVTVALATRGLSIGGFDADITSDVPLGAGLSSSASLEVAVARAIAAAFHLSIDPVTIASIAHQAETDFVGAPVGVMDQMAASLADADTALFLDTRSLSFERLPLPDTVELIVIDSGVTHSHATGEYRVRRAECDEAARRLGVALLRDLDDDGARAAAQLPPPLDRRVRHVLSENARVLAARGALASGDGAALGRLLNASHASLRDDFEVSTADVDALVAIAQRNPAVLGARMTGGGFGGSIVAIARRGSARAAGRSIVAAYSATSGRSGALLIPR
jgi:galactokinase